MQQQQSDPRDKMIMLLCTVLSNEDIIDKLSQTIEVYKTKPSEEALNELTFNAFLLTMKSSITAQGGLEAAEKRMNEVKHIDKILKNVPNN